MGRAASAPGAEGPAALSNGVGRLMSPLGPRVLLLSPTGRSCAVEARQEGPVAVLAVKSNRDVAALAGGELPPRLAASKRSNVAPPQKPRTAGSRILGRRVDPQTEIGRRACGERVAKPAPGYSNQLNPRSTNR